MSSIIGPEVNSSHLNAVSRTLNTIKIEIKQFQRHHPTLGKSQFHSTDLRFFVSEYPARLRYTNIGDLMFQTWPEGCNPNVRKQYSVIDYITCFAALAAYPVLFESTADMCCRSSLAYVAGPPRIFSRHRGLGCLVNDKLRSLVKFSSCLNTIVKIKCFEWYLLNWEISYKT